MCGFAGVLGCGQTRSEFLDTMAATLLHRGPDDQHVWTDTEACIGLGHTRLSIIDLSPAGSQPMTSPSGRYVIAYNGEIYNHLELRAELRRAGHAPVWRGHSDTETLLANFDVYGVQATLQQAVGMFAFGVWDRATRTLTLGRDRLGEKPLYYGWQGGTLLFGSELKALKAHPLFNAEIDRDAVAAFMRFGYVPAPRSIYRGVSKLPPGTTLTIQADAAVVGEPVPYWSLIDVAHSGLQTPFTGSDADAIAELERLLSSAIALQSVADVPLGAFLSGGIDSSLIVALMQAQSERAVQTFTMGFHEEEYDEAQYGRAVAAHLGTDHTEFYVTPDEARSVIPLLPQLYDEPFADSSQIPTYLVSRIARRHVTVSLSGDAGDELFGGYNRHVHADSFMRIPRRGRQVVARVFSALSPAQWNRAYAAVSGVLPDRFRSSLPGDHIAKLSATLQLESPAEVYQFLVSIWPNPNDVVLNAHDPTNIVAVWNRLDADGPQHRMMLLDALTYLPDDILCKVDRAAMGVSLETRVPFLDHRVVEFAWRLPLHLKVRDGRGKWILRRLLDKHVPSVLTEHPKTGFGVPISAWLRGPLREWAEDLLNARRLDHDGYLNSVIVQQKWQEHLSGRRNWQHQLWNVLMFQAWLAERNA
jgi:asparagine synthase (glutamine-hydrolysing)